MSASEQPAGKACPECSVLCPAGAKFCWMCGAPLVKGAERTTGTAGAGKGRAAAGGTALGCLGGLAGGSLLAIVIIGGLIVASPLAAWIAVAIMCGAMTQAVTGGR